MNVQTQDFHISGAVPLFHETNIRLLTRWRGGGVAEKVHSRVNAEAGIYMQEARDASAAGSLASPAWNSTHE